MLILQQLASRPDHRSGAVCACTRRRVFHKSAAILERSRCSVTITEFTGFCCPARANAYNRPIPCIGEVGKVVPVLT
jgi:hypothetical protein